MNILKRAGNSGFIYTLALFFTIGLFFFITSTAFGRPFRLEKLPDKGKNFKCRTCHESRFGGKNWNAFGMDYQKYGIPAGDIYSEELGALDSDGDGFTNDQEFKAGTNPGDPKSKSE